MINSIGIQNFKCYKDKTTFPLSKINLLTGINGKGKSTFLQSILLFKQTVEHNANSAALVLNGDYVRLGTFQDVKNTDTSLTKPIVIEFDIDTYIDLQAMVTIGMNDDGTPETDVVECHFPLRCLFSYELGYYEKRNTELMVEKIEISHDSKEITINYVNDGNTLIFTHKKDKDGAYSERFRCRQQPINPSPPAEPPAPNKGKGGVFSFSDMSESTKELFIELADLSLDRESYNRQYPQLLKLLPWKEFDLRDIEEEDFKSRGNKLHVDRLTDFQQIHFVSADRLGPQEYYPKQLLGNFMEVGKQGEKVLDVLIKSKDKTLKDDARILSADTSILALTGEWLSEILDTKVSLVIDDDSPYISTLRFRFNDKEYSPPNVGFGFSYILPIVVAGLIARPGELLIIENPEAHLHPRAQSRLAKFLAIVASCGVQVFVESHSEHILNGIRLATLKKENAKPIISHTDISVLYFQEFENQMFTQIPIQENGRIKEWPEGFFDQIEKDTEELYGL